MSFTVKDLVLWALAATGLGALSVTSCLPIASASSPGVLQHPAAVAAVVAPETCTPVETTRYAPGSTCAEKVIYVPCKSVLVSELVGSGAAPGSCVTIGSNVQTPYFEFAVNEPPAVVAQAIASS